MNNQKFVQLKFFGGRLLFLITALLLAVSLVYVQAPEAAFAMPFNPPDGDDDRINPNPPPFEIPEGGFTWSVPVRYGMDRDHDLMIDTYWRAGSMDYDPKYIYPDTWPMSFWACQTAADADGAGTNIYQWNIDGYDLPYNACEVMYNGFTEQGTHHVTLTVTHQDGTTETFPQDVYIKDYLIVAIGDSLASGEGNPDKPMQFGNLGLPVDDAKWQDRRCHRTANAYPSKAAMALEYADPHTSVTFISFACSGATILTPAWDPIGLQFGWPPLNLNPDPSKYRGIGILGSYIGNETDDYNINTYIPPQIDQLQDALTPPTGKTERQFDALIMSAGGNDLHFGDIAMSCLFGDNCWPGAMVHENLQTSYNLEYLVWRALHVNSLGGSPTSLPDNFAALATAIDNLDPQPAKVYITQYADQTRGDVAGDASPRYCSLLFDILSPWGYGVTPQEAAPLSEIALWGMNNVIEEAAAFYGWQYVDGISSYEVDPDPSKPHGTPGAFVRDENGNGHGYCASDNWIVRADESEIIQGPWPVRLITKGTLHPNGEGIQLIKDRLLYYMLPDLEATNPGNPPGAPPTFSSSFTSGGLTSQPGANGWFTGSCDDSQNCSSLQVVLQVTATGTAPLEAANVYLNDQAGCTIPGVMCPMEVIASSNQVKWNFKFTTDGFYRMQFSVSDSNNQIADYVSEIKVDLHDPVFEPLPGPYSVDEGSSITLNAQASDTTSAILNFDWDLDNDGEFETTDEQPVFSAADLDGLESKTIGVLVTDEAGRFATATPTINILNVAPTVTINGAPETSPEGTAVNLTSSVTDPGTADTFTYDWVVKKNGSSYASGANAYFSFTPGDEGSYVVSLTVTDNDGGVGMASQTIIVENVAPSLSISAPESGALYPVNTAVNLSALLTDPSILDTLTCSVNWDDGGTEYGALAAGVCTASHVYTTAGVYTIQMTGADDDLGMTTASVMVVVYDPSGGFVTGGGWIDSPAGAYTLDPSLVGRAGFGFVSKYHKGTTIPSGQTEFQFDAGSFYFESEAYDWLVVAGARAQFKGTGAVNSLSGYTFLLTLTDGDINGGGGTDKFRIKIWDASGVIYDNMIGYPEDMDGANPQAIGGGSIVIHSK